MLTSPTQAGSRSVFPHLRQRPALILASSALAESVAARNAGSGSWRKARETVFFDTPAFSAIVLIVMRGMDYMTVK